MPLKHAILGFLRGEPMSGYDLKTKCFDADADAFWTADQAQVYRTLDRLVRDRKVTVQRIRQRGKPDRKLFSITPDGRDDLRAWVSSAEGLAPLRDPFLLKLLFADELTDEELLRLISEERMAHQDRLTALRTALARRSRPRRGRGARTGAEATATSERAQTVARIALEGALAPTRAVIDWLDDAADQVSAGIPAASGNSAASPVDETGPEDRA